MIRFIKWLFAGMLSLVCTILGVSYFINYHPSKTENIAVDGEGGSLLSRNQSIKILNWNVQYMAGKNYVFYYDLPDGSGPDTTPSLEDMGTTMEGVAQVIREEAPDIILLQEVDIDSKHTHYVNEFESIKKLLPESYKYSAFAYYHKSLFVPHPKIMGRVGMGLCVISKYPISKAIRHQLPQLKMDPFSKMFFLKRCVLECHIPYAEGGEMVVLNTHPEAFSKGSDIMQQQMNVIAGILEDLDHQNTPWIIGGDFNLLPPGQKALLPEKSTYFWYSPQSELKTLTNRWSSIPTLEEATGANMADWFTHFPNNPVIDHPDRTLDYFFYSPLFKKEKHFVRSRDTLTLSDHLPVISTFSPINSTYKF